MTAQDDQNFYEKKSDSCAACKQGLPRKRKKTDLCIGAFWKNRNRCRSSRRMTAQRNQARWAAIMAQ